jgi:hypothetical protein
VDVSVLVVLVEDDPGIQETVPAVRRRQGKRGIDPQAPLGKSDGPAACA